jgi:hypothetical protein
MIRRFGSAGLCLAVAALAGCSESGLAPDGVTSSVEIRVYVDTDASGTFTAGDRPVQGAIVALSENDGSSSFQATTDAEGVARLDAIPTGSYTASVSDTGDLPTGAVLSSVANVTIRTGPSGSAVSSEFRYAFPPGTISGRVYRDENDSGAYESGKDTPAPAFDVRLYAGADTTGTAIDSTRTSDTGLFTFDLLAAGAYTVLIRAPYTVAITGGASRSVTVAGDQPQVLDFEFTGATVDVSIADASSRAPGTWVLFDGFVTGETNTFGTRIYVQGETGGIQVFLGSGNSDSYYIGDALTVSGRLSTFRGQLQVASPIIRWHGWGVRFAPRPVTFEEVNARTYEGQLARATGTVSSVGGGAARTEYNVTLKNLTGDSIVVRVIGSQIGIPQAYWVVGEEYSVAGILSSFDGLAELFPRRNVDVLSTRPLTVATVRRYPDGTRVATRGVVNAGTATFGNAFYVQDATGGIKVVFDSATTTPLVPGDSVVVVGELKTLGVCWHCSPFSGEQVLTAPTLTIVKQVTAPTARVVTGTEASSPTTLGQLVTVKGLTIRSVGSGSDYKVAVTAPDNANFTVYVPGAGAGIPPNTFTVGSKLDITGVMGALLTSNYDKAALQPRSLKDIVPVP